MILVIKIGHRTSLSSVKIMFLVEFFFVGLFVPFANSNYEYDYGSNSNYDPNAMIEECDGADSDQLSENNCFCYDEPETDISYSICKKSALLSGMVMYFSIRQEPQKYICIT